MKPERISGTRERIVRRLFKLLPPFDRRSRVFGRFVCFDERGRMLLGQHSLHRLATARKVRAMRRISPRANKLLGGDW